MIPKIIHYCWFGNKSKSKFILQCIASWKKFMPDYEILEWNESNIDLKSNSYLNQAYLSKKYAFVSDYVRLQVLYKLGGIYFDTDVEVIKSFDTFLSDNGFIGYESKDFLSTAVIGAKKSSNWIKTIKDSYNSKNFIKANGSFDEKPNVIIFTKYTSSFNKSMNYNPDHIISIYPIDYFSPKNFSTGILKISNNTYSIHHFNGSWLSKNIKNKIKIQHFFFKIIDLIKFKKESK